MNNDEIVEKKIYELRVEGNLYGKDKSLDEGYLGKDMRVRGIDEDTLKDTED